FEIIETTAKQVVAMSAATERVDIFAVTRAPQFAQEDVLHHFHRRLSPPFGFVSSHLFMLGAVNDPVFAIEMRGHHRSEQQGRSVSVSWSPRCGTGRGRQSVILAGPGGSATDNYENRHSSQHAKC